MRVTDPLDPSVASLVAGPRAACVSPGSDSAASREAPLVTGDPVVDTQLENLRNLLCDSVVATHKKVIRTKNVRLWAIENPGGNGVFIVPPSKTKRDDHPAIQNLIQMAAALARIDANTCEATVVDKDGNIHTYICNALKLKQEQMRIDLFTKIQSALKDLDASGMAALKLASDTVKSFHAMAQQWKIHTTKLNPRSTPPSDLQRLAAIAFKKDTPA